MEKSWRHSACRHVVFFGLRASAPGDDFATYLGPDDDVLSEACSHEVQKDTTCLWALRLHDFAMTSCLQALMVSTPFHDLTPVLIGFPACYTPWSTFKGSTHLEGAKHKCFENRYFGIATLRTRLPPVGGVPDRLFWNLPEHVLNQKRTLQKLQH